MPRYVPAPFAKSRSAARLAKRAVFEAGVIASLTLAILTVAITFGIDRAAAAGLDVAAGADDGHFAMGAVLLAVFAGLCVLTSFMLRDTFALEEHADEAHPRSRLG